MCDYGDPTADFSEKNDNAECEGRCEFPEENTADDEDNGGCGQQDEVSGDGEGCRAVDGLARKLDLEQRSWNFAVLHVWDDELV